MSKRSDNRHKADLRPTIAVTTPAFTGRLVVGSRQATCYLADCEVRIDAPGKLLARLAALCDGRTAMADVVSTLGRTWNADDLARLIDGLIDNGVICEASRLAEQWWSFVRNPDAIRGNSPPSVTPPPPLESGDRQQGAPGSLVELLQRRGSTRIFGSTPVPYARLRSMFWASYGVASHRTVPSAGALYPLQIHWVNFRATGGLEPGVYRLGFPGPGEVTVEAVGGDPALAPRAFLDCDVLFEAQGILVVSGSLARTAQKYGTRSALYVPLEAGHVAQNVLLAAAEAGVAAVEIGGFYEEQLSRLLDLPAGLVPLTSVIVGSAPSAEDLARAADAPAIEFQWMETDRLPHVPPFFAGSARVAGESGWSCGRSTDPATAYVKAGAEALERWSCTRPSGLYEAAYRDLGHAHDPRTIAAYQAGQYDRAEFPYRPFDDAAAYPWKDGVDILSGERRAVLADFVYFADFIDRQRPYTDATSSGAAAYPTAQGAMERAVLELIERDAFMRTWLGRATRPTIDPASLPATVAQRVRALRDVGVEVVFKDHSLDGLVPVVFAFAQSTKAGFTVATSAAAYESEEALTAALMELELSVALRLASGTTRTLAPADVETPLDHADLYAQRRYYRRADFLAAASDSIALSEVAGTGARTWDALCGRLRDRGHPVLWFDLTPSNAALYGGRMPLIVGRAVVPGLIPISFGQGREPLALSAIRSPTVRHRRRSADLSEVPSLFPHPFQ